MKKKLLALLLGLTLCLSLAACGGDSAADSGAADTGAAEEGGDSGETVTLTVAASPTPHAVILEQCVPILAEQGIDLVINQYSDYVVPNTAWRTGTRTPTTSSTCPIWRSSTRPGAPIW